MQEYEKDGIIMEGENETFAGIYGLQAKLSALLTTTIDCLQQIQRCEPVVSGHKERGLSVIGMFLQHVIDRSRLPIRATFGAMRCQTAAGDQVLTVKEVYVACVALAMRPQGVALVGVDAAVMLRDLESLAKALLNEGSEAESKINVTGLLSFCRGLQRTLQNFSL